MVQMNKIIAVGDAASSILVSMKNGVPPEDYMLLKEPNIDNKGLRSKEDLQKFLGESKEVILIVCLGGKTGSKLSSKIISMLHALDVKALVVAQMPFRFEGRKRNEAALEAFRLLEKRAYNLIVRSGQEVLEKNRGSGLTLREAFDLLDKQMIKAICEVL